MATYPSPVKFEQSTKTNYQVRSIQSDLGDGYQSVTPDGINHIVQGGTIVHQWLAQGDTADSVGAQTIRAFLKANCGTSTPVTIPNYMVDATGATPINVYLLSWSETYVGDKTTFSIAYRECFS